jgi:hypothetical protein
MDYSRIAPAPCSALNCQTPAQKIAILPKGKRHDLVTFLEDFKKFSCKCSMNQRINRPKHRKTLHIYNWKSSDMLPYGLIFDTLKQDNDFKAPGCKMLREINFKPDSSKVTALKIDKEGNMTFIYKNYKLFEFFVNHQKLYIYNASFHALTGEDNMTAPRSRDLKKSNDKHIKFNNIIVDLHEFLIEYNEDEYNDNNKINYEFLTFSFSNELYNNIEDEELTDNEDEENDTESDTDSETDTESDTDSETDTESDTDDEEEPQPRQRRQRQLNIFRGSIPDILDTLYYGKYNDFETDEPTFRQFKTSNNSFSIRWEDGQYNIYSYNQLIAGIDNMGRMALILYINKLDYLRGRFISTTTSNHVSKIYNYFKGKLYIKTYEPYEQLETDIKYNLNMFFLDR